jgi:hypothetical protein
VAALAAIVLVLPACGSEPAKDTGGGIMSAKELAAVLVAPKDLGGGWSTVTVPESEGGNDSGIVTDKNRGLIPKIEFCDKASKESSKAAAALDWKAFRQLNYATETPTASPSEREPGDRTRPQHHIVFVQEFLMSGETGQVEKAYDALAAGVEDCWGEETKYPDGEVGNSSSFEVPAIGDDRIGTRELVKEPGPAQQSATWDIRNVIARDGDVLLGITVAEITTEKVKPMLDDARIGEIVTTIADRLP